MLLKRRTFIQAGSLATASFMVPSFLKGMEQKNMVPPGNKVLLVLQLSGGNDGLNTVVPYRNDIYYKTRPGLSIKREEAIRLTDDAGLHPALKTFKSLYDEGSMAIMNNVGYPNPDRSHFRSMDIWQSASGADQSLTTGWIGRYLDAQCNGCDKPTRALEIDDTLSLAMKGEHMKGLAMKDPRRLFHSSNEKFFRSLVNESHAHEEPVAYLYKTMAETVSSADYIYEQSRLHPTKTTYPGTEIGRSLKTIASLIFSDINTSVYYLSLGTFDTHVAQQAQQKKLFIDLDYALAAFVKDLKLNHRFDDVLIMTFSEFGRRVAQNASGGTDHGTANNMFFAGGALKQQGLLNDLPDLTDLTEGDLKYTVDFRNVYSTVLNNWLQSDAAKILGSKFSGLGFV